MNNRHILRKAFPFIAIFFVSLSIAGYTFVQQNLSGAKAGDEALSISAVNVRDPLTTNDTWDWKLIGIADRNPTEPIALTYEAQWCLRHDSDAPCLTSAAEDFFYKVGNGTLTLNTREITTKITHQSVNCGRVELQISRDGQVISRATHSTNTKCTQNLAGSVSAYGTSPEEITQLINDLFRMIFGLLDEDGDAPKDEVVGTNPENPSQPGGGICQESGQQCAEAYRETCTENGQAGSRVCHKHGICAAPGSGVQCSWGEGSFCEKCKAGTSINDPVPPVQPPQTPPGGGENPQPPAPEPLPLPADADAQKAAQLANYLLGRCVWPLTNGIQGAVTQHNVRNCAVGSIGTRNDGVALSEVITSATGFGSNQIRNGARVGYNHLQCVGFTVAAVAAATGNQYSGPSGDAWARCKNGGGWVCLPRTERPRPNDQVIWGNVPNIMPFGHIAYVVETTGNSMTVIEANNSCIGCVRRSTYVISNEIANRNLTGFMRKQ